ncbi:MAG TPA: transcriptional regulator GcvA [Rhizobiaceae bacterium]|nr:transcriptional regulator GcvA [Rhizobiaceae bacterium]
MALHIPGTRALRAFDAAARHLNFSRAAEELGLTPAAISHQIKEFEDQLGVELFTRTSRTIRPTEAGLVLQKAAAEALELLGQAASRAKRLSRGVTQLKLSLDPLLATKWMIPKLERFRTACPDIDLRFDVSFELRDFDRDDVDIAIRFGAGRYEGLISHRLMENVIIPVCSPKLLKSGPPLKEPRDLLNHTLVHIEWSRPGIVWPNWRTWMAAAGVEGFDPDRCIVLTESTHVIQAAIDGNVVSLCDFSMVASDLSAGRLVRPFELGIGVPEEFAEYLVYPIESANDAKIVAFRDWLLSEVHSPQMDKSLQG